MSAPISIDRFDQIPDAISKMQAAGAAHRVPLLQALYHGRIAHLEIQRDTSANSLKFFIGRARLPALVLVGDDDYAATGPAGWRQASRMMRWARRVIIHAAGADTEQYKTFVQSARSMGRLLLVETDAAHAQEWVQVALAHGAHGRLCVILPAQGVHPVCPPAGQNH